MWVKDGTSKAAASVQADLNLLFYLFRSIMTLSQYKLTDVLHAEAKLLALTTQLLSDHIKAQ